MQPPERNLVWRVWQQARRAGQDPVETLNERALLLTSQRFREVRRDMLYELADELENVNIGQVLAYYGSTARTAYDAQRVLIEWIRAHAKKEERS